MLLFLSFVEAFISHIMGTNSLSWCVLWVTNEEDRLDRCAGCAGSGDLLESIDRCIGALRVPEETELGAGAAGEDRGDLVNDLVEFGQFSERHVSIGCGLLTSLVPAAEFWSHDAA
jgi:hypothetical protein